VLGGTPTAAGTYAIPVQVADSAGATAAATLSLDVAASAAALAIVTTSLPPASVGQPYAEALQASGGSGSDTWSYSGSLPAGISLSSAGVLAGTPTSPGAYTLALAVTDAAGDTASQALTLSVAGSAGGIVVVTSHLPDATLNQAYSTTLTAQGGAGGDSWTSSGSLPPGMTLTLSGQLSGTPTAPGDFGFTVIVTDSAGNHASASLTLVVEGTLPSTAPLAIATTSVPNATVGVPYATTLTATGGAGDYTWTYSGSLAPGLGLSQSGVLSGTPSGAGIFYITLQVRDAAGVTATQPLTVTVAAAGGTASGSPVTVTTSSLPQATLGQAYSTALSASGGTGNYTWVYTGSLPQGMSLSPSGTIAGTPTTSGTYPISVQAVDSAAGSVSAARQLTLTVVP
jgi:hypothetical protein